MGTNQADRFHPAIDSICMQVNDRMAPGTKTLESQGVKAAWNGGLTTAQFLSGIVRFINMYTYVIFCPHFFVRTFFTQAASRQRCS